MKHNSFLIRCTMAMLTIAAVALASGCDKADILRIATPYLL